MTENESDNVPTWDDNYLENVSKRLTVSYDIKKDFEVKNRNFSLFGELNIENRRHFFHPSLNYANHESKEYLFVDRFQKLDLQTIKKYVDIGHQLAKEWIEPDETHYKTEFTFVFIHSNIDKKIVDYVSDFRDRNLLKYGYYGDYEINLVVVAPLLEDIVRSQKADVGKVFATWEKLKPQRKKGGILNTVLKFFE